jgi:hypothetical protein
MLIISLQPEKTAHPSAHISLPILENRMAETKTQVAASNVDKSHGKYRKVQCECLWANSINKVFKIYHSAAPKISNIIIDGNL